MATTGIKQLYKTHVKGNIFDLVEAAQKFLEGKTTQRDSWGSDYNSDEEDEYNFFREFVFSQMGKKRPSPKGPSPGAKAKAPTFSERLESEKILEKYGISSKSDYYKWLKTNHPDRGGSTAVAAEVTNAFNVVFRDK
jgi:hypothetical protein